MKILYIDAFSGVSGDKMVAALLGLSSNKKMLIEQLSKLNIKDEFNIKISNKNVMGIESIKFDVILKNKVGHRGLDDIKKIQQCCCCIR